MREQKLTQVAQVIVRDSMLEVEHYTRIPLSGFEGLYFRTRLGLMDEGYIRTINHDPEYQIIGLRGTGVDSEWRPAMIAFEVRPQEELAHVIVGGVEPTLRGMGYYKVLWEHLVAWVRLTHPDIKSITGAYHVNNLSSARMNEKLGRKPLRIITEFHL